VHGEILEGDSIPTLTATFFRVMWYLLEPMFPLRHPLSSLLWFLGVAEVVSTITILEDENVGPLEVDMVLMEADRVRLIKAPDNVSTVDTIITSPRRAGRNLVDQSGHC